MRLTTTLVVLAIALSIVVISCNRKNQEEKMSAPIAKKIKKELTIHNHTRIDNYYWLNDRDDPEVIQYLKDENAYTKSMLKHTEDFQQKLFDEMVGRIKQEDISVPYKENGYFYYSRYEEGKEYPIYCRKKGSLASRVRYSVVKVLYEPIIIYFLDLDLYTLIEKVSSVS